MVNGSSSNWSTVLFSTPQGTVLRLIMFLLLYQWLTLYPLLYHQRFALRGFSPGTPVFPSPLKPTLPNSNLIWNKRTGLHEFIWTLKCFVGKKAIYIFFFNYLQMTGWRAVTMISSCRVNTTSKRGIKQLGISFSSIFHLFSHESSWGPRS